MHSAEDLSPFEQGILLTGLLPPGDERVTNLLLRLGTLNPAGLDAVDASLELILRAEVAMNYRKLVSDRGFVGAVPPIRFRSQRPPPIRRLASMASVATRLPGIGIGSRWSARAGRETTGSRGRSLRPQAVPIPIEPVGIGSGDPVCDSWLRVVRAVPRASVAVVVSAPVVHEAG
jgi:hypothetical protein